MNGFIVRSRAELVAYLHAHPVRLRAARSPLPPRVGHPDFIGPVSSAAMCRPGAIQYDADGVPFVVIEKEKWEEAQVARLRDWGIDL